ncbi:MAG: phosphoribosylamine--glycine ligase [Omnitrophica bacterium RBG_13_46_9]|nr:MAG: phosphoribosylamine--glycine ligase [Omnitrophica bacterium RBG_13_46_9]
MKILIVGQGGREHALAWKIRQTTKVKTLYCAPGNGGTAQISQNIPIEADDLIGLRNFCEEEKVDLTVVGPEMPLSLGITDLFKEKGLRVFGPSRAAAQLEASKVFTKELSRSENIPTADFEIFEDAKKAKDFVKSKGAPIVVKADGLAAGKGVIVAKEESEALEAIDEIMVKRTFGSSGNKVIVEECLEGEEASIIVVSDGENIVPLASSQDHKRVFDGDRGPNTGGMGAYSPAPAVTDKVFNDTISSIIKPAIRGMRKKGIDYRGALYAGVMLSKGEPKLLEFNVRFGDPETQAIFPRLKSDFLELIELAIDGSLKNYSLGWDERSCVCVVMAAGGYPGRYEKGKEIFGIEKALEITDTLVFHAGTDIVRENKPLCGTATYDKKKGKVITNGGRVLNVIGLGKDIKKAIDKAYSACGKIKFDGMHYRKDIGYRAVGRLKSKARAKNIRISRP